MVHREVGFSGVQAAVLTQTRPYIGTPETRTPGKAWFSGNGGGGGVCVHRDGEGICKVTSTVANQGTQEDQRLLEV